MRIIPESIKVLIAQARNVADQEKLSLPARRQAAHAFNHAILPPGEKKSKKQSNWADAAYADYRRGKRGNDLFRHIPGYVNFSQWRREREQRRLMKRLNKRAERERKKSAPRPPERIH